MEIQKFILSELVLLLSHSFWKLEFFGGVRGGGGGRHQRLTNEMLSQLVPNLCIWSKQVRAFSF